MEKLKGIRLTDSKFPLKKMGDFLFHEGPLQSHFINDKIYNRWMFVKVEEELLYAFFQKIENTVTLIKKIQTNLLVLLI